MPTPNDVALEAERHSEILQDYIKQGGALAVETYMHYAKNPEVFIDELQQGTKAEAIEALVSPEAAERYRALSRLAQERYNDVKHEDDLTSSFPDVQSSPRHVKPKYRTSGHRRRS